MKNEKGFLKCRGGKVGDKRDFFFRDMPVESRRKMQLDAEANYSVTEQRQADAMSKELASLEDVGRDAVVTDATACVGGNTMSFAKHFKHVNSIEMNEGRFQMLKNNCNVLGLRNISFFNRDFMLMLARQKPGEGLQQDVIFFDPPWGGVDYMKQSSIHLFLSDVDIADICESASRYCKYLALKVPLNFALKDFRKQLAEPPLRLTVTVHKYKKWLMLIVDSRKVWKEENRKLLQEKKLKEGIAKLKRKKKEKAVTNMQPATASQSEEGETVGGKQGIDVGHVWSSSMPSEIRNLLKAYASKSNRSRRSNGAIEVEARLGLLQHGSFVSGVDQNYFMRLVGMLNNFKGWLVDKRNGRRGIPTERRTFAILFHGGVRVTVEAVPGRAMIIKSVEDKDVKGQVTFETSKAASGKYGRFYDIRCSIAEENPVTDKTQRNLWSGRAMTALASTSLRGNDAITAGCRIDLNLNPSYPAEVTLNVDAIVANTNADEDDPVVKLARENNGKLPNEVAQQIKWYAQHGDKAIDLQGNQVHITGSDPEHIHCKSEELPVCATAGNIKINVKNGDDQQTTIDWHFPACRYFGTVIRDRVMPHSQAPIVVSKGMKQNENEPNRIKVIREKIRRSFNFDNKWQFDLTRTRQASSITQLAAVSKYTYEVEFEYTYKKPKNGNVQAEETALTEATYRIIKSIVDTFFRHGDKFQNSLYRAPPPNSLYNRKKGGPPAKRMKK